MKKQIQLKKPTPRGFTIVEVTIFLAVSMVLLTAAIIMVGGKQAQVSFSEKMRDAQAEINEVISDVPNGFTGGDPGQQYCELDSTNHPVVITGTPSTNYVPTCTFLGKAIQFDEYPGTATTLSQASNIYTYSIFGANQTIGGAQPADLVQATPAPAVGQTYNGQPSADLTDTFSLNPAYITKVKSCTVVASGCGYAQSHLVGFLLSLNTDTSTNTNGSEAVNSYAYRFDGSNPLPATPNNPSGNGVTACLSLESPCGLPAGGVEADWPERLQSLEVCFTDGTRNAQIYIYSAGGYGASTKLVYGNC